jgi:hypothetical protein
MQADLAQEHADRLRRAYPQLGKDGLGISLKPRLNARSNNGFFHERNVAQTGYTGKLTVLANVEGDSLAVARSLHQLVRSHSVSLCRTHSGSRRRSITAQTVATLPSIE